MPAKVLEGDGRTTRLKESDRDYQMLVALNAKAVASDLTAVEDALALKAPLASPALTGVPIAPTAAPGNNTTQIATTEFVTAAIAAALAMR